jgi:hypothetical protein
MTRPPRNPRRAYDADGNMREHGVRSAIGQETSCGHSGTVNVDSLPDSFPIPDVSLRLQCSVCGSRNVFP